MRAARVHEFGDLADVRIDDVPEPRPGDDEILVQVTAAALNPIDYKVALSGHRGGRDLPLTLGFDAVGTVEAIGTDVTSVRTGDRVCLMTDIMAPGTAADLVLVREHNVSSVPLDVSDETAAGLPLAALTAHQAWDLAGVQSGQSVLVHAGAGGVGHLAIQLAKLRGAEVCATASAKNLDLVAELGADHPVDYHATSVGKFARNADVVLDTLGGDVAEATLRAMRAGGTMVSIVGYRPGAGAERPDVRVERMLVEPRPAELSRLVSLVNAGHLRVLTPTVAPLERIAEQLEELHAGHTVGKRILAVNPSSA